VHVRVGPRFGEGGLGNECLTVLRCGDGSPGFPVLALSLVSCTKPTDPPVSVAIEHTISPEPARVGPASITFKLADSDGKRVTGAKIVLEADMSHAGMSPVFAEVSEAEPGRYLSHLEFPMAGDWVVLLHITLPGGKKLERQIDVKGVRPE